VSTAEFGRTVRRWRDRSTPEAAGLPTGGHRRAAGLRREELAQLAGISVDYVTRLEQGRATSPSGQVVEALTRALRLDGDEREHLFRLAGLVAPGRGTVPAHVTPGVHRLLDRLAGTPVAVHDAIWTLIIANPMWTALFGDASTLEGIRRNVIWQHFLGDWAVRVEHTPAQQLEFETAAVADLRGALGRYPADTRVRRLVAELCAGSERFAELWESGAVGLHANSRKTVHHPQVGSLLLDCDVLSVAGVDLRIVAYTAEPASPAAERLALLSVLGTQTLPGP
jgi:transcriptional regulator with XRE-family HTH domain